MNLLIISGLSGSGKTIALQALEDLGIYCIDNLPAALLPHFVEQLTNTGNPPKTAVIGLDARNRAFLKDAPKILDQLKSMGINYQIIFLEANDAVLVKRFKETRRKHPMIDKHTSLLEGITLERKLLEPLSLNAALRVDTTHRTPHQLRQQIQEFVDTGDENKITLLFESFGFKHGTPLDADYVFDVRCLPNPYWQPELRRFTGMDEPIERFMTNHDQAKEMINDIRSFIDKWLPVFMKEGRSYITIAIGCTGGQHRSVYIADKLGKMFSDRGVHTQVRHRELP
ncbi:MAG: RNase adapter RapZ [Gammaproteobacteria bacterium]|nr:RNase adapter RapZ [Gammaproteobacteria bacterium]